MSHFRGILLFYRFKTLTRCIKHSTKFIGKLYTYCVNGTISLISIFLAKNVLVFDTLMLNS